MKEFMKNHGEDIIIFTVGFLALLLIGTPGYDVQGDAMQYIEMGGYLPPLYPVFLWILRSMFGEASYLTVTVFVQCMLGAFSMTCILHFISRKYRCAKWILGVMLVMLFAPYVRESMREVPRYMYSHLILTEAISIPLFYLYVWSGMHAIENKRIIDFFGMNFWAFLLVLSRAQFLVCIILNCVVLVYLVWNQKNRKMIFFMEGMALIIIAYLSTGMCEDAYKQARLGTTKSAWNSAYFLLHALYASDAEDVAIYEEPDYQELYARLYKQLDEIEYNYKYLSGTVYDKSNHWSVGFSKIYRDLKDTVSVYVEEQGITDRLEQDEMISQYVSGLMKPLFVKNGISSFLYSLYQFPISMCSNVFVVKANHMWFSYIGTILIYIVTACVGIWRFRQKHDSFAVWFMVFMLCFMIGNSLVVGYVLHTQARYLLYSMGTFYVSLVLLAVELWREKTVGGSHS